MKEKLRIKEEKRGARAIQVCPILFLLAISNNDDAFWSQRFVLLYRARKKLSQKITEVPSFLLLPRYLLIAT